MRTLMRIVDRIVERVVVRTLVLLVSGFIVRLVRRWFVAAVTMAALGSVFGCGGVPVKRHVIDSGGDKPAWAKSSRDAWEDDDLIFYRGQQQVRGNERLSGCYDLARQNAFQALLSEVRIAIKSRLDSAQLSLSEDAEYAFMKGGAGDTDGSLQGMRFIESYFERSLIGDTERIDCQVLGRITSGDYQTLRRMEGRRLEKIDSKVYEQLLQRQAEFFSTTKPPSNPAVSATQQGGTTTPVEQAASPASSGG